MSHSHLAPLLLYTAQHGGDTTSGWEGHVGGFRSAAVQRHIAADLAAAADGAWENTDQLPEAQPQRVVQSIRQPGGGSAGQGHAARARKRLAHMRCYVTVLWDYGSVVRGCGCQLVIHNVMDAFRNVSHVPEVGMISETPVPCRGKWLHCLSTDCFIVPACNAV